MSRTRLLSAVSGLALFSLAGPLGLPTALAQDSSPRGADTAATDDGALQEIVVTAQRRAQALSDVPLAVTAIDGEQFERSGLTSVDDLTTIAPSVTFGSSATSRGEGLVVRGFGTTGFSDAAEGAVGLVFDGVVMGRQAAGLVDLIDVERIEVLRGPQGTLFGKNASAGVVSIVTRRPSDTFEGSARFSYGTFDEMRAAASLSGPLAQGVSARLSAFANVNDGTSKQLGPLDQDRVNDENQWGVRGQLLLQPTPTLDIRLIAEHQEEDALCCNWSVRSLAVAPPFAALQTATLGARLRPSPANRHVALAVRSGFQRSTSEAVTADVSWQLGEHTVRSITGWRSFDISEGNKTDALPISFFDLAGTDSEVRQASQELQLLSPEDGTLTYVVGLFWFDLEVESIQRQEASFVQLGPTTFVPTPLVPASLQGLATTRVNLQNQQQSTRNAAVYGQATWNVTDQFSLTAGARFIDERLEVAFDRSGGLPLGAFGQAIARQSPPASEDQAITGMLSARFEFTEDVSIYGTYSRGYKGVAYDLNAGSPVVFDGQGRAVFRPLEPETVDNFEVGLRSFAFDRRLQVNATAFNTVVENYQANAQRTDGVPGFILANVGEFRTRGLELETAARPTRWLDVGLNVAWIDAEYVSFPRAECPPAATVPNRPASCAVTGTQDLSGAQAANAPEWSGSAFAGVVFAAPGLDSWDLYGRGEMTFRSDTLYSLTQDPNTVQEGFVLFNARLGVRSQAGLDVALWGRNLTDEDYAVAIFSTSVVGGYSHFLAPGRTIGIEVRADF